MCNESIRDDGETVGLFSPLMVSEESPRRTELNDLAIDLAAASAGFAKSLPASITNALIDLMCTLNSYYSNLIEGHETHPIDIERALIGDYSEDPNDRVLQLEAKAHIAVQKWIDEGGLDENPTSPEMIMEVHRRFCELLPPDLLFVEMPSTGERIPVVPGELRKNDVAVGLHVAVSPGAVPRFLDRLHEAYRHAGRIESILAVGCGHHRLVWVHPFLDGNGRVARLMSYAMLRNALDTKGLWSVARGLARNEADYKRHLAACDMRRRNDLDGRGTLSESALADFSEFFLKTCIDQIKFMEELMNPDQLHNRILNWAKEEMLTGKLPADSDRVLHAVLLQGSITRADAVSITGDTERSSRCVTSALLEVGALKSDHSRAPLRLAFPAKLAGFWMPELFPDK